MSKDPRLQAAVSKAEKNGFDLSTHKWEVGRSIIFNHDFAKAIWGDKPICPECEVFDTRRSSYYSQDICNGCGELEENFVIAYEHHLQKMVLEKDPLKYLEQFI